MSWWQLAISAVSMWLIEFANRLKAKPETRLEPAPAKDHEAEVDRAVDEAMREKFGNQG